MKIMKRIKFENIFMILWVIYVIICLVEHSNTFLNSMMEIIIYTMFGGMMYYIIWSIRKGKF